MNPKVTIHEKLNYLKELSEDSSDKVNKSQFITDGVCSTLEYISKTDGLVSENRNEINTLLVLLNKELCSSVDVDKKLFLKSNFFEIFAKFFKYPELLHQDQFTNCWFYLLKRESWKYLLMVKFNILVDVLSGVCKNFWQSKESNSKFLFIITCLCDLYLKQVKTQYNVKKVFVQFCKKLLSNLVCVKACCQNLDTEEANDVDKLIDKIFLFIFSAREHMLSLKGTLQQVNKTSQSPAKKQKVDLYYNNFFEALNSTEPQIISYVIQALPSLYTTLIKCSRTNQSLPHQQEFELLIHISEVIELKEQLNNGNRNVTVHCFNEIQKVVLEYDIYQTVEDAANEKICFNWMKDLIDRLLERYKESNVMVKKNILEILTSMLETNHLVLECYLEELWKMCLDNTGNDSTFTYLKETLLCNLLTCYDRLHQLDKFVNSFRMEKTNTLQISYPVGFIDRYCTIISGLQNSQINLLLETYLNRLENLLEFGKDETLCTAMHLTYLSCYLVLINAAVIPESGYMKEDIKKTLHVMRKLKLKTEKFVKKENLKNCSIADYEISIALLVQHGINNLYLLLRDFSLVEDEDHNLFECYIEKIIPKSSPVVQYLQAGLHFDKLKQCESVTGTLMTLHDILKKVELSEEYWNKQVISVSSSNIGCAIMRLYEENILTILAYDNTDLIALYAIKSWEFSRNSSYKWNVVENIACYNNTSFQCGLLTSINDQFFSLLHNKTLHTCVQKLLKKEEDSVPCFDTTLKTSASHSKKSALRELKIVKELPLDYFVERNLLALFVLVVETQQHIGAQDVEINEACIDIMIIVLDSIVVLSHNTLEFPLELVFLTNLQGFTSSQKDKDLHIFGSCMKAIVKFVSKNDDLVSNICSKIKERVDSERHFEETLEVCNVMLHVILQSLLDPVTRMKSEQVCFQFVLTLTTSLFNLFTKKNLKHKDLSNKLFHIYTKLSRIVQRALQKRSDSSPLHSLEEKLLEATKVLIPQLHSYLESIDDHDENIEQYLTSIEVMYDSTNDFTLQLRGLLKQSDLHVISSLIKKMESSLSHCRLYAKLISTIVVRNEDDNLSQLFDCLTLSLIEQLHKPTKQALLLVWSAVLTLKFSKEQKLLLWKSLPKVMLCCVQMLNNCDSIEDVISALKTLTACVDTSKHSVMSQYVTCIYHVFVIMSDQVTLCNHGSFVVLFEELYHLASQLLFHHQSAVYTSLPAYLTCINCLLNFLVSFTQCQMVGIHRAEDMKKCCERLARLYREVGSHKTIITKYAPYIIADYVRACQQAKFGTENKNALDTGIHCIMDTCSDFEFALLTTLLEGGDKEHFRMIRNDFEKHHKFVGKA